MKQLTVELVPNPDFGGFTARVPDIPAYGEGETEEAAIADLKEALLGYVEMFGLEETWARVNSPTSLRQIEVELDEPVRA